MTENLTIRERAAWYRRRRSLSQEVLAGLVGCTTDWPSTAENDRIELDRLSVITSLADALDVSPSSRQTPSPHPTLTRGTRERRPMRAPRRSHDAGQGR
ncbi:helix-turn-helix domain-containing protein [Streptomyces sp. NBC_00555]|uniref:helix-turn-helix domain-containing protein n=1 Tax=Streptomyces sp. NBC_00555 TaxID=2903662 RepID=UPI002255E2AA|nr:helix-turn-helix transcriptional regulator [Streptomyces sp. NBC_00555]MCX5011701.1 helix-turn-helix domain-containing protein [Streptomyces sp. NBC_00555]